MPKPIVRARLLAPTAYGRKLANTAIAEYENYHEYAETDTPLRNRIRNAYCGSMGFGVPSTVSAYAWSAVFVSWCVKEAGATGSEFKFAEAHSVFVHAAIANAINDEGVFRGYAIDTLAPQIGDIIQNNRGGTTHDFAFARDHKQYTSHSAIVVDIVEESGTRYAITIGGNESDSIRRKRVRLDADGRIVQRAEDPYICIIQTTKPGKDNVILAPQDLGANTLSASFRKHGTFVYDPVATIEDYGSIDLTVAAMRDAGMSHAWLRVHGTSANTGEKKQRTRDLTGALQAAGISVAGWGWCQGSNAASEAALALRECEGYGITDYIADIEEGVNNSHWTRQEVETFCRAIRADLPGQFGVTTFALIDWHEPELMKAALPFVHFFNPQVYWFGFPNTQMVNQFRRPDGTRYRANIPGEYMDLCIDRWNALMGTDRRPLVVTGQAYWSEGATKEQSESRLAVFLQDWNGYNRVAGLNWWHFGGTSAMSHAMLAQITAADLGAKPYAE